MTDAYAPTLDPTTLALSHLVPVLAEATMFAAGSAPSDIRDTIEGVLKRRSEAHVAFAANGTAPPGLLAAYDTWLVDLSRAIAPVAAPVWLPMADVLKHKVTLEAGARGIRSLFSSKPSEKDVLRVKRLGTLAVRGLRAVLASDGVIDDDERRTVAALIAALGLPEADAMALLDEEPVDVEHLDVYGELDADVAKAILAGAWFAAAADGLDPREETIVRSLAFKLSRTTAEAEEARGVATARVERGRLSGMAVTELVRTLLADRVPGDGADVARALATFVTPRRYRDEVTNTPPSTEPGLGKRYAKLESVDKASVLAMTWAAALREDPPLSRRAALRARFDRLASELGEEGGKIRVNVEAPFDEAIATLASGMR